MKKLLSIALLALLVSTTWAQEKETTTDFLPKEGEFGVVFNVAGLISNINVAPVTDPLGNDLILGKYYFKDNHVFRLGFGVRSYNNSVNFVDSVGSAKVTGDSTYSQFNLYLSPAYEYHLKAFKRLDPYIGAGVNFGFIGKVNQQIDLSSTDTTGTDKQQTTYTQDGGFMFGIQGIMGFNYYIAPRLALGLEYNIGYYWARAGGDWERVTVTTPVSGSTRSVREIGSERYVNSGFDHSNNLSINVSYYFGGGKNAKTTSDQ